MKPTSFWKNPEGVELACYEWVPPGEIKFIVYLAHGYAGSIHDYTDLDWDDLSVLLYLL